MNVKKFRFWQTSINNNEIHNETTRPLYKYLDTNRIYYILHEAKFQKPHIKKQNKKYAEVCKSQKSRYVTLETKEYASSNTDINFTLLL